MKKKRINSLYIQGNAEAEVDGVYLATARKTGKEIGKQAFKQGDEMPDKWKGTFVIWHLLSS